MDLLDGGLLAPPAIGFSSSEASTSARSGLPWRCSTADRPARRQPSLFLDAGPDIVAVEGAFEADDAIRVDKVDDQPIALLEVHLLIVLLIGQDPELVDARRQPGRPPLVHFPGSRDLQQVFGNGGGRP